jgi:glycosyltransferase involved in cell wall biosynthesis
MRIRPHGIHGAASIPDATPAKTHDHRRLLMFDSAYTLEAIRHKQLEESVTSRDLGGFFEQVWTVHPFASLLTSAQWGDKYGRPVWTRIAPRHVFVEGKIGRFKWLAWLLPINFVLAQVDILLALIRLVRVERVAVIRTGDPFLLGLYALLIARVTRLPVLLRLAGNYESIRQSTGRPLMPRVFRWLTVERAVERFVLKRVDLIAAGNEENARYVRSMGIPADRVTLFRPGNLVAAVHFSDPSTRARADADLSRIGLSSETFILCVSRLERVKLPDHAIRVLDGIRARGAVSKLVMVGDGSMRAELEALCSHLGITEFVVFAGERSQEWLARVIPRAAVVLSPLTGRALIEVALGAAPVVAYDLDWQGELIRTGETGRLVAGNDVNAMAQHTYELLQQPDVSQALGRRLRATAIEMMDPNRLNKHERLQYLRLIERRHADRAVS